MEVTVHGSLELKYYYVHEQPFCRVVELDVGGGNVVHVEQSAESV